MSSSYTGTGTRRYSAPDTPGVVPRADSREDTEGPEDQHKRGHQDPDFR